MDWHTSIGKVSFMPIWTVYVFLHCEQWSDAHYWRSWPYYLQDNILVAPDGHPVLFNIVTSHLVGDGDHENTTTIKQTSFWFIKRWMPPEVFGLASDDLKQLIKLQKGSVTMASDIWAYGMVLHVRLSYLFLLQYIKYSTENLIWKTTILPSAH